MTDEQQATPQEVVTTEVIKGKIKWFGNVSNPVPALMANVGKALRYGCTAFTLAVNSAPDGMFTPKSASAWSWWMSVIVIMSGVFELLVGVEPVKKNIPVLIFIFIVLSLLL